MPGPPSVVTHDARPRAEPDPRVARLTRLARVWGDIRFKHPFIFDRSIDWDGALVNAIPKVSAALDEDAEAVAVGTMLAVLHDPLTRVEDERHTPYAEAPKTAAYTERGVTVVTLGTLHNPRESRDAVKRVTGEVAKASLVVIDLRGPTDETSFFGMAGATEGLAPALVAHDLSPSPHRWIQHEGFAPQRGSTGGGFRTYFATESVRLYQANHDKHPDRVAFIVSAATGVPPLVAAMQRVGDAVVVAQGTVGERADRWSPRIPLGAHHAVRVRDTESLDGDWTPDARVDDGGAAVTRAIHVLTAARPRRPAPAPRLADARIVVDPTYPDESLPPLEHRLLAAFRLWNTIRLFYPYKALMDAPWEGTLAEAIPQFEAASTPLAYQQAIAELSTRVPDSHVWVEAAELKKSTGTGVVNVDEARVDGLPVVTWVAPSAANDGFESGDVLLDVGGESFDARAARVGKYIASSNAWTHARDSDSHALYCERDTRIEVRVRDPRDAVRTLTTTCGGWTPPVPQTPPFRRIDDAIGYVDLDRLQATEVDAMFDALGATRAIVFDMRGYPRGATWALAQRLNLHDEPKIAARVGYGLVTPAGDADDERRLDLVQHLPPHDPATKRYTGKTVMLIDERTQSAAETTALFFEAANGTKLIGSPSAGANGDGTGVVLPGDVYVNFSGDDYRHADGRPIQRVGLQPDVLVRPTLKGIRAGRDEVLDRALAYVRDELHLH